MKALMIDKDLIRAWTIPLCVVIGVVAVVLIFSQTMNAMTPSAGADANAMKEVSTVASAAIAMIGTLVGFVAGQAAGAAGKDKADERASNAMDQAMTAEKRTAVISGMSDPDVVEQAKQKYPDLFK